MAIGCSVASARRLARAVAPTPLDPGLLARALGDPNGVADELRGARLSGVLGSDPALGWEHAVLGAGSEANAQVRAATLSELLTELDGRAQDGARIPRACASIATSAGFLCATAALLQGLAASPESDPTTAAQTILFSALAALLVGVAGATFCAAVHLRARRASKARVAAAEALVARLLEWTGGSRFV